MGVGTALVRGRAVGYGADFWAVASAEFRDCTVLCAVMASWGLHCAMCCHGELGTALCCVLSWRVGDRCTYLIIIIIIIIIIIKFTPEQATKAQRGVEI
jgi:hypothetical protein